jgi:hypothetical protein
MSKSSLEWACGCWKNLDCCFGHGWWVLVGEVGIGGLEGVVGRRYVVGGEG